MGLLTAIAGGVGGLLGLGSGNEEGRRIERGGRQAQRFLEEGRDYAINESGLSGYRDRGAMADETFFDAIGIGGNPAAADAAFRQFQDSTGFRSQLQAGQDAIGAGQAAAGKFNSGATGKGLVEYGQNLGRRSFNDFIANLNTGANRGFNAASGLANAATGTAANQAQTAYQTESDSAAARKSGQDNFFEGLGPVIAGIGGIF